MKRPEDAHGDRLAALSPEKRRLYELLQRQRAEAEQAAVPARLSAERFAVGEDLLPEKAKLREFYDTVTQQLDASPFGEHALFLNYGYVPNDTPQASTIRLPENHLNKNATRLVLELVGDFEILPGHAVLDVGCGRGGTCSVLRRFFRFGRFAGLDLSPLAIAFCARTHRHPDNAFVVGDAERLPFEDGSFDAVTNVESSHGYGDVVAFYREVHRVLGAGGVFLYTDLIPEGHVEGCLLELKNLGFSLERALDITSNVLLSCEETASAHARAFLEANDRGVMDAFLGTRGSRIFQEMRSGQQRYMLARLRKTAPRGDRTE